MIIAFSFFQFGILQLPATIMNSQIIIAISTLVLFSIIFLTNKFSLKLYVPLIFIVISILFFISYLYRNDINTLNLYLEFLLKSFSLFLIGSYHFNSHYLYKYFKIFSIINLVSLALVILLGYIDTISYMRFGYALLPSLLVSFIVISRKDYNFVWIITFISSFIFIFLYGSRGPFVSFIILTLIIIVIDKNISKIKKTIFSVIILISYVVIVEYNYIFRFLDYLYYDLEFKTYSILKFRVMLENGVLSSSSGRDTIYLGIIDKIYENPIFGHGVGASDFYWDYTTHNFVLQILLEFGLVGAVIFFCIFLYFLLRIKKLNKVNENLFYVLIVVLSSSLGRLFVSSDLWLRPEFWLGVSLLLQKGYYCSDNYRHSKLKNKT